MIQFDSDDSALAVKHAAALEGLRRNVVKLEAYDKPVLIEGAEYNGIWLECGPLEGAVYGAINPAVAVESHRIFFRLQREDGYLPCWIRGERVGAGQIQMVVPIAATAWEVYQAQGDRAFLEEACAACGRWDAWLARYRDTLGLGLCEAFCEYDTGHDNSPRFRGLPHACPENDARIFPSAGTLPYAAPDLTATVYGGRVALAQMARELGREEEARQWAEKSEETRRNLLAWCFDPETACFYDLDRAGKLLKLRGDALTRVLSEHVADAGLFETIYRRHIRNPQSFWTPYPLPSIAADDALFVNEFPRNSWAGASQALTALRAPRWFEHYGKRADLVVMMRQWVRALTEHDGFRQQLNPFTGVPSPGKDGYSPAMLVMIEYVSRLHGIRLAPGRIEWTCLPPPAGRAFRYRLETAGRCAELEHADGASRLRLDGREIGAVTGACRIITDRQGRALQVQGVTSQSEEVTLRGFGLSPVAFSIASDKVH